MSLDQFEVESNTFYSGSYTDNIFMGSMLDYAGRFLVASQTSGSTELQHAHFYSEFSDFSGPNRNRGLGISLRIRNLFSTSERYQDTVLPDIFSSFKLNGGIAVEADLEAGSQPILLNTPDARIANAPVGKLVFATFGVTASFSGIHIADETWFGSHPFQNRYKNIVRNANVAFYQSSIPCAYQEMQTAYNGYATYVVNSASDTTTSLATIELMLARGWVGLVSTDFPNLEPIRFTLIDLTGSVVAEDFYGNGLWLYPPVSMGIFGVASGTIRPNEKQISKLMFGIGDNYQNTPIVTGVTSSKLQGSNGTINTYYASSVDIRGWRYGVVSAFPYYSSCIFRSSRFGQFRDMFEQRKNTKFFDPFGTIVGNKGLSGAAVQVKFVSGSSSEITSSNPSFNPNDSGNYDFECKSGQPWQDVG